MRLHRYSSFVLTIIVLSQVLAQQPKNIVYRATPKSSVRKAAAMENELLKERLEWTFGGKAQHGWQLFEALIRQAVHCEAPADDEEFADAVSHWQQSAGLAPNGVLNQETWMKMVEQWQSRRRNSHTIPGSEKLLTVVATDFYDPERPVELRQVEAQTYLAYKRLVAAAAKDLKLDADKNGNLSSTEKFLKIISAYRSPEYQRQLRAQSPQAGRAALAVNSPHFTGAALDLYVGGEPVSTKDSNRAIQVNSKVYCWLVKNAAKFGFIPYFYEPWHWEFNPQASS